MCIILIVLGKIIRLKRVLSDAWQKSTVQLTDLSHSAFKYVGKLVSACNMFHRPSGEYFNVVLRPSKDRAAKFLFALWRTFIEILVLKPSILSMLSVTQSSSMFPPAHR